MEHCNLFFTFICCLHVALWWYECEQTRGWMQSVCQHTGIKRLPWECRTKWGVQCSARAVQIREHIPPPVSNVDSILYEHSDVAPSGLVCSFILTIAVYLFKYFCKCWFNNDLFIHLCCIIYVGVFIHYLLSFLFYLKMLPEKISKW